VIRNCGKNGKAKTLMGYANPNGSIEFKNSLHVQRIGDETANAEYNLPTSPRPQNFLGEKVC